MEEKAEADRFKPEFKYFKRKFPPPDLSRVLDAKKEDEDFRKIQISNCQNLELKVAIKTEEFGLRRYEEWEVFQLKKVPGLIVIKNPFCSKGQIKLALNCLKNYSQSPPNKTNQWNPKIGDKRKLAELGKSGWYEQVKLCSDLMPQLRWSTLGYHHNWDTKIYNLNDVTEFPKELADLVRLFSVKILNLNDFKAEAAIVNYYPMDATLSGHTDHSEPNLDRPLFSISLGQSAIFLIGGREKSTRPVSLFLHSGDVLIMTEDARKSYHAVPRIIKSHEKPWLEAEKDEDDSAKIESEDDLEFTKKYLEKFRININVRQVF